MLQSKWVLENGVVQLEFGSHDKEVWIKVCKWRSVNGFVQVELSKWSSTKGGV